MGKTFIQQIQGLVLSRLKHVALIKPEQVIYDYYNTLKITFKQCFCSLTAKTRNATFSLVPAKRAKSYTSLMNIQDKLS